MSFALGQGKTVLPNLNDDRLFCCGLCLTLEFDL